MSDNEGRLHDCRELDVAVPLMLPLELIQQSLVGGLGKAEMKDKRVQFVTFFLNKLKNNGFLHLLSK